jgi:hypothetical protein
VEPINQEELTVDKPTSGEAGCLEIVRFRLKYGAEDDMLSERPNLFALLREAFPGLRAAHRAKLDDRTWLDVLMWDSRAQAETAQREEMQRPEIAAALRHVEEVLSMDLAEVRQVG